MEIAAVVALVILVNIFFFPLKITVVHKFEDMKIIDQNGKYLIWFGDGK